MTNDEKRAAFKALQNDPRFDGLGLGAYHVDAPNWDGESVTLDGEFDAATLRQMADILDPLGLACLSYPTATEVVYRTVAERLARMLKLYIAATDGVTQKQIAAECEMSESTLSRFIAGEQQPDGRAFFRLVTWCFGDHRA